MCEVCVAVDLIEGKVIKLISSRNKNTYGIQGTSERKIPEHGPCSFHIFKNGKWSQLIKSEHSLADIVLKGGFDIHPDARSKKQDQWLDATYNLYESAL